MVEKLAARLMKIDLHHARFSTRIHDAVHLLHEGDGIVMRHLARLSNEYDFTLTHRREKSVLRFRNESAAKRFHKDLNQVLRDLEDPRGPVRRSKVRR